MRIDIEGTGHGSTPRSMVRKERICNPKELHGSIATIVRSHLRQTSVSTKDRPAAVVTLAQRIGWSALIAWKMWLIFGPAVVGFVKKVTVKTMQGSAHVRKTGRGGIRSR
jgi:hypothetical protein